MIEQIYDRIGGAAAIGSAVNMLYKRLMEDPVTKDYFTHVDVPEIKKHQRRFLAVALGGSEAYYGRDVAEVHRGLRINNAEFNVVLNHLMEILHDLSVSPADITEVRTILESQRPLVVAG